MKIALYGGAFNPVHNEHVNIVKSAKNELGLDKIIIIPTSVSPHKSGSMIARNRERLEMCRLAFGGIDGVEVSDCEIKRGGVSYSYVTCRRFKKLFKDDDLYFIIGEDMLKCFEGWREPEEVLKCVTLAVCARGKGNALKDEIVKFQKRFKRDIVKFSYVGKDVSSTKVRTLAALDEDISVFVPEKVKTYIKKNKLYALPELFPVKKYLTEERWRHTVRVALTAAQNCKRINVYEIDAITAAALHDCAKYLDLSADELKGFTPPEGVPATVMHQYSGAYVAEHTFKIRDEYILNAIRYHSSGRENMGNLEKLIFLSDLLEDGRHFEGIEKLRAAFKKDMDECLYLSLEHQLNYLNSTGAPVYPLTKRAFEYLKNNK